MENKSLGRGFREISNIFISKDNKSSRALEKSKEDTKKIRRNLSDEISDAHLAPFTVVNPEHDAYSKKKTDKDHAKSKEHHESTFSNMMKNSGEYSNLAENMREVEEYITVEKNISYPDMPDARQNIITALCRHLEEGFRIKTIELVKTNTTCRPGKKKNKTEKVTIFLEDPPELAKI